MLLGDAIMRFRDETSVEETLATLDDWVLMTRMRGAADAAGLSLGSYASAVVGRFIELADDNAWLALMTAVNRAANPGVACLKVMVELGLAQPEPASPFGENEGRHDV
jgi:hypothetical protein